MIIDTIFKIVLEIILCLISIGIYTFLVGSALPSLLLRFDCPVTDRGLKKYTYPNGRGILYEPHPALRQYVSSYILFVDDGVKYIRCKVTDSVECIGYSAVVFDRRNRIIDVVRVTDAIGPAGCTKRVALPMETSYVTLLLDSVNEESISVGASLTFNKVRGIIFACTVTVATVAEAFLLRATVLGLVEVLRVFIPGFPTLLISMPIVLIAAIAISALGLWAMFLKKRKGGLKIR